MALRVSDPAQKRSHRVDLHSTHAWTLFLPLINRHCWEVYRTEGCVQGPVWRGARAVCSCPRWGPAAVCAPCCAPHTHTLPCKPMSSLVHCPTLLCAPPAVLNASALQADEHSTLPAGRVNLIGETSWQVGLSNPLHSKGVICSWPFIHQTEKRSSPRAWSSGCACAAVLDTPSAQHVAHLLFAACAAAWCLKKKKKRKKKSKHGLLTPGWLHHCRRRAHRL